MSELKAAGVTLAQNMEQFEKTMLEIAQTWTGKSDEDRSYERFLDFEASLDKNIAGQAKALLKADKKKVKELAGKFKLVAADYLSKFTKFVNSTDAVALRQSDLDPVEALKKLRDNAEATASSGEISKEFKLRLKEVAEKWDKAMVKAKNTMFTNASNAKDEVGSRIIQVKAALLDLKKADIAGTTKMAVQWEALGQSQKIALGASLRDQMKKFENALRKVIQASGLSQYDTVRYQAAEESVEIYFEAFHTAYAQALITTASGPVEKAAKGEGPEDEQSLEIKRKELDTEVKNGATRLNNDAIELVKKVKNANSSVEVLVNEVQGRRGLDKNDISKRLETAMSDLNNFKTESEKLLTQYTNLLRKHKGTPDLLKKYVGELSSAKTKITGCDGLINNAKQQEQLIKNHLN